MKDKLIILISRYTRKAQITKTEIRIKRYTKMKDFFLKKIFEKLMNLSCLERLDKFINKSQYT